MKNIKYLISAILMLFCASVQAEEITENFDNVSMVDANGTAITGYTAGVGLSNGWKVVDGKMYLITDYASNTYSLWDTANSGSNSLCANYGASNTGFIVIPEKISGKLTFYYRRTKTSTSNSYKGKFSIYEVEQSGDTYTYKRSIKTESYTTAMTSFVKYEIDLGETPMYIAFNLALMAIDDVTYNTAGAPHETHEYATEWSKDEAGHWHACTAEGFCDTPKADFAAHDGLTCSVCGYESYAIRTFPWVEDFESITSGIPTGWDNSEGTTTTASYKWNYYSSYSEGKSLRFNSYNNSEGLTNVLATPYIVLPAEVVFDLKFKVKNPKGGNYSVQIGEYGSTERTTVLDNLTNIANWTEQTVNLSAYAGKAIKVYFCGTSNWATGDAYLYLDDVTVKENIAHVHNYAEAWSKDRTNHWHVCLSEIGECDAPISGLEAHTFDENDICAVCGYEKFYELDFTTDNIPAEWNNCGWVKKDDYIASDDYLTRTFLVTSYLKAEAGNVFEVVARLRYTDEPLSMKYSVDQGETWTQAFSVSADADHYTDYEAKTLTFAAPTDGEYLLRFEGSYVGIKSIYGFKDTYKKDLNNSTLHITAENQWSTLCYPNGVNIPEGAHAYTATDVVDGVIELVEIEGIIPANTPVLVYAEDGAYVILPETKHVTSVAEPVKEDGNLFVGCTGAFTLNQSNQYILQKQNDEVAFYRVNPEKPITTVPYRCYLETELTEAAKLGIAIDETTGISEVKTENRNGIYDLSGRKVEKMQKGVIYIINNHKVIVK